MYNRNESYNNRLLKYPKEYIVKLTFEMNIGLVIHKKTEYKHLVHEQNEQRKCHNIQV